MSDTTDLTDLGHRRKARVNPSRERLGVPGDTVDRAEQTLTEQKLTGQNFDGTSAVREPLPDRLRWLEPSKIALVIVILGCGLLIALWALASLRLVLWFVDWLAAA